MIRQHIEDALALGARATVSGPVPGDNRYLQPTILVDVPKDALVATQETFGPVLALVRVKDTEEAVALVNSAPYGLGSSVFSRERGPAIASRLRVGMTSVNDAIATSRVAGLPFGGRGHSGFGRKHGDEGLLEFACPQAITVRTAPGTTGSSFERPAGAVAATLAATVDRLSQKG
ncbi:hypothetical protein GCM10022223_14460 [Kineosporia mesophila]|uniref:Aldehyde dehydrogenase domain-containing protein n=1 Tax=Kineosporia mesophila TaxID=566012 RepID=A0ABP6Z854_9ACTN|nr:aldehyde dehydrogenase family protein [Kineosporia mesophila]MCD5352925.1 aldehyde dehydrogenase family protein [Kineosporia mesophila]